MGINHTMSDIVTTPQSTPALSPHLGFYHARSAMDIIREGALLYAKYWTTLTKPLIAPLALQAVGIGLSLGLSYLIINGLHSVFPAMGIGWTLAAVAVTTATGMYLFFKGFWDYLVWFSGLCLVIRDLAEINQVPSDSTIYSRISSRSLDFSLIWLFMFSLYFIPLALGMLPICLLSGLPHATMWILGSTAVIMGVGYILAGVANLFLSLSFQSFAFYPASAGSTFFKSADMVSHGILKTCLISFMTFAAISWVIPSILISLLEFTPLLTWSSEVITHALLPSIIANYGPIWTSLDSNPDFHQLINLTQHFTGIAVTPERVTYYVIECTLYSLITALLLPLGTCWFTLLYADLKTQLVQRGSLPSQTLAETPV
jgi:hypothetical protein